MLTPKYKIGQTVYKRGSSSEGKAFTIVSIHLTADKVSYSENNRDYGWTGEDYLFARQGDIKIQAAEFWLDSCLKRVENLKKNLAKGEEDLEEAKIALGNAIAEEDISF